MRAKVAVVGALAMAEADPAIKRASRAAGRPEAPHNIFVLT
jgi:hypothetical protein